jgi:uncharacterized alpha-E superfamily protein
MLARVANSLYWTGRYIERSEHLARYLKVQYFSMLDAPMSQNKDFILQSIMTMYGLDFEPEAPLDEPAVLLQLGLDAENPTSLLSTIFAARENARSVRYTISTELWEVINQYYLFVREYSAEYYQSRGLYDFTVSVAKHCAIVRSYLDHTLVHDDVWVFIELGIHLERAAQIARILNSKLHDIEVITGNAANIPLRRYQWTITLKVLEAFDMHRRVYRKAQTQPSVIEFLTSNIHFPRSIAYNLHRIYELVQRLETADTDKKSVRFKAGKLSGYFSHLEYSEIKDDLPGFLNQSLDQIYGLHTLIDNKYFQTSS